MLDDITTWVTDVVDRLGYLGVAFLVALENVFPPIPSEAVLPLAGFVAGRGDANLIGMILAATAGSGGRRLDPLRHRRRHRTAAAPVRSSSASAAGSASASTTCSGPRTGSTGGRTPPCSSAAASR